MQHRFTILLLTLQAASVWAQQSCNPTIPLTRPYTRYEVVTGTTPSGSEVRDKVTGLIWQRCVLGMEWNGSTCTNSSTGIPGTYTWQNALVAAYNAKLSTAASGAAATWRVPSHAELYSLAERACSSPAINTTLFPPATPADTLWSSSPVVGSSNVWVVEFSDGSNISKAKSASHRVRLVRSGQ